MRHFLRLILRFDENQIVSHACQDRFLVLDERDLIENPASGKTRLQFVSIGSANSEIAAELNKKGWRSSGNRPFSAEIIQQLCRNHKLLARAERLCAKGLLSARQIAQLIESKPHLVDYWRERGLLNGVRLNDKNEYLYERPAPEVVQHIKRRTRLKNNLS